MRILEAGKGFDILKSLKEDWRKIIFRNLIFGVFLLLLLNVTFAEEEKKKTEEEIFIENALKKVQEQKSMRFSFKMDVKVNNETLMGFDLSGDIIGQEKLYVKGKMNMFGIEIPDIETYTIGDVEYDRNPKKGIWEKKVKEKKEEDTGDNPFKASNDLVEGAQKIKLVGEHKLRGVNCLVYEFQPTPSKVGNNVKYTQSTGKILIEKESQLFRKLYFKGKGKDEKGNPTSILMDIEFYDFGAPITIEPPLKDEEGK